jgi:DNA-binding CsgD family transcriptional regulator
VAALLPRHALTPAELAVARLAAAGRTNRDIAERLKVVQRTVEMHLSSAYRKLGIRGRSALTGALGSYMCLGQPLLGPAAAEGPTLADPSP